MENSHQTSLTSCDSRDTLGSHDWMGLRPRSGTAMFPCSACSLRPCPAALLGGPCLFPLDWRDLKHCFSCLPLISEHSKGGKVCDSSRNTWLGERRSKAGAGFPPDPTRVWSLFLILSLLMALPRRLRTLSPHCHQLFIACFLNLEMQ